MFSFCSLVKKRGLAMVYFVALPFVRLDDGGLAPGEAIECSHAGGAVRRAQVMSGDERHCGAIAFSRRGDPNLGDFDDAVILRTFGDVPEDFVR
jgi:hypothetical protein